MAQLSRMSHCAPAARKPVRFKFTCETQTERAYMLKNKEPQTKHSLFGQIMK